MRASSAGVRGSIQPPLTTAAVPKREMGRLAVRRLLELLSDDQITPHKIVLYTQLIERASTAPPRQR